MTYRTEFPDFDHEVPAVVTGDWDFADTSWGAEMCPKFTCDVFELHINYADRTKREPEMRGGPLYTMTCEDEVMLETDSWEDVRAFVDDGKRDFPAYEWSLAFIPGEHIEITSYFDGGPAVVVEGEFAIVQLIGRGSYFLVCGNRDMYCNGARADADEASTFDTLDAARAELALAKAAQ